MTLFEIFGSIAAVWIAYRVIRNMYTAVTRKTWRDYLNAESEDGTFDFFNIDGKIRIHHFDNEETINMTEKEWLDLVNLVKRIS